jgi:quercetin dioxygenase-like cupin family protein
MKYVRKWEPDQTNEKGQGFKAGRLFYYTTNPGAVRADHTHPEAETLWVIKGKAELQVGEEREVIEAPCMVEIPGNIYHKLTAITQTNFIEQRT